VGQFLQAEVFGVPLPAYSVMTDERFEFLGNF
jgi:YidC/Oxa1 family membrane protein insertase